MCSRRKNHPCSNRDLLHDTALTIIEIFGLGDKRSLHSCHADTTNHANSKISISLLHSRQLLYVLIHRSQTALTTPLKFQAKYPCMFLWSHPWPSNACKIRACASCVPRCAIFWFAACPSKLLEKTN